jgi:Formyl transferase
MSDGAILLAGHRRSLASVLLTSMLASHSNGRAPLRAVFCVSELSFGQICQWYVRYRTDLWPKIKSALGHCVAGSFDDERQAFLERLSKEGVSHRRLDYLCKDLGIPFHLVTGVNSDDCLRLVDRYKPEFAIYSGGGILRERFLRAIPRGVLNLHCGPLPHIRGMNAVEWSLFFGFRPTATLHYIDVGIDTGEILADRAIDVQQGERLGRIRARTVISGIDLLLERFGDILSHRVPPRPNPAGLGRQYFAMSPILKESVQNWIDRGVTPVITASAVDPNDQRSAPVRAKSRLPWCA